MKNYDVVIIGGGMAGLTAAAYISRDHSTLLIEKQDKLGGLVGSFTVDGFVLDQGARGIIDSGIVLPMLKQLGIELDFFDNPIKMIVEHEVVDLKAKEDILAYGNFLKKLYPDHKKEIDKIIIEIQKVMTYMDVLYGIENPLFLPKPYSMDYLRETLFPWIVKFLPNIFKAMKMMDPIEDFLYKISQSKEMSHIIAQHFFESTPTFFALSYFSLYLQYKYPKGSTQSLVNKLTEVCENNQTDIHINEEVIKVDLKNNQIITNKDTYQFKQILWAADILQMYKKIDEDSVDSKEIKVLNKMREKYQNVKGAESVLSIYYLTDCDASVLKDTLGPHCFYTANKNGLSNIHLDDIRKNNEFTKNKEILFTWLKDYLFYNTFEVSIPALRDQTLAPKGKSALIISTLMDYKLTEHIASLGLYDEFKMFVDKEIRELFLSYIPQLKGKIKKSIISTPLTIQKRSYAHEGSLSGYSFANHPFPAEYRFLKVSQSIKTPFKNVKQAGQFVFNPAGVPVAILTGKLAADQIIKELK